MDSLKHSTTTITTTISITTPVTTNIARHYYHHLHQRPLPPVFIIIILPMKLTYIQIQTVRQPGTAAFVVRVLLFARGSELCAAAIPDLALKCSCDEFFPVSTGRSR
jgi:hypothetical protein